VEVLQVTNNELLSGQVIYHKGSVPWQASCCYQSCHLLETFFQTKDEQHLA